MTESCYNKESPTFQLSGKPQGFPVKSGRVISEGLGDILLNYQLHICLDGSGLRREDRPVSRDLYLSTHWIFNQSTNYCSNIKQQDFEIQHQKTL